MIVCSDQLQPCSNLPWSHHLVVLWPWLSHTVRTSQVSGSAPRQILGTRLPLAFGWEASHSRLLPHPVQSVQLKVWWGPGTAQRKINWERIYFSWREPSFAIFQHYSPRNFSQKNFWLWSNWFFLMLLHVKPLDGAPPALQHTHCSIALGFDNEWETEPYIHCAMQ